MDIFNILLLNNSYSFLVILLKLFQYGLSFYITVNIMILLMDTLKNKLKI